jgi:hypothetical protein
MEERAVRVKRFAGLEMAKQRTPAWLTDEALERTETLGREMVRFLDRRSRIRQKTPRAKVEPSKRLLAMIARLKREHATARKSSQ